MSCCSCFKPQTSSPPSSPRASTPQQPPSPASRASDNRQTSLRSPSAVTRVPSFQTCLDGTPTSPKTQDFPGEVHSTPAQTAVSHDAPSTEISPARTAVTMSPMPLPSLPQPETKATFFPYKPGINADVLIAKLMSKKLKLLNINRVGEHCTLSALHKCIIIELKSTGICIGTKLAAKLSSLLASPSWQEFCEQTINKQPWYKRPASRAAQQALGEALQVFYENLAPSEEPTISLPSPAISP